MKHMFTPGPASLHRDCLAIEPCFGRGDPGYSIMEKQTMDMIRSHCGQENIVALQGSATLALEIAIRNLLQGHVCVIETGYYSRRLFAIAKHCANLSTVESCPIDQIPDGKFDWIVACPVETAAGSLTPISHFREIADCVGARLFLDATASVGLETGHSLADAMAFSSCKGLFGLAGAAFVAYNNVDAIIGSDSYYLDLHTHINRGVTGPYHVLQSLHSVLQKHDQLLHSVKINKQATLQRFQSCLVFDSDRQPLISTALSVELVPLNADVVLYQPRDPGLAKSVICHLGELHLGLQAQGHILDTVASA